LQCVIDRFTPAIQADVRSARKPAARPPVAGKCVHDRLPCATHKHARRATRSVPGGPMLHRQLLAAAMLALALCPICAAAQTYPSKPIKMIVPYTPGSPVDVLARVVTQQVSARLGQTIVIDNRPGAGTTIGTKAAAEAAPDGYTLLIGATSFVIAASLYPNIDYDPIKSFAPVAMLAISPQMLVIAPALPAKTVPEFVAYAKARPGELNFGFGLGTLPQILGESFKVVTGTDIISIPYKGGGQAITDMLGGRIHMNFGTQATLLPLIRDGRIR